MAININTNIPSLSAPQINRSPEGLDGSLNRLSPGLRIDTQKDDAAGLKINDAVKISIPQESIEKANSVGKEVINTLENIVGGSIDTNQIDKTREMLLSGYNDYVKDIDFATESAAFQKHNLLALPGNYAISQANSLQENVAQLLR